MDQERQFLPQSSEGAIARANSRELGSYELAPDLEDEFGSDRETQAQWSAFVSRNPLFITPPELPDVLSELQAFLMPVVIAAETGEPFDKTWEPNTGWT